MKILRREKEERKGCREQRNWTKAWIHGTVDVNQCEPPNTYCSGCERRYITPPLSTIGLSSGRRGPIIVASILRFFALLPAFDQIYWQGYPYESPVAYWVMP